MMDTFTVLQQLSKTLKKPIRKSNLSDSNAKESGTFTQVITLSNRSYLIQVYANTHCLCIQLNIKNFVSKFLFSINREDRIFILYDKIFDTKIGKNLFPVYIDKTRSTNINEIKDWLTSDKNVPYLKSLDLKQDEHLHFYANALFLYIRARTINDLKNVLDALSHLADNLPKDKEEKIDLTKLPHEFHKLIPLIKKWGIGDDVQRIEKLEKISLKEKREFYRIFKPYFPKINSYLNSFGENLPEEAVVLMYAAEAAAEVQAELEKS